MLPASTTQAIVNGRLHEPPALLLQTFESSPAVAGENHWPCTPSTPLVNSTAVVPSCTMPVAPHGGPGVKTGVTNGTGLGVVAATVSEATRSAIVDGHGPGVHPTVPPHGESPNCQ